MNEPPPNITGFILLRKRLEETAESAQGIVARTSSYTSASDEENWKLLMEGLSDMLTNFRRWTSFKKLCKMKLYQSKINNEMVIEKEREKIKILENKLAKQNLLWTPIFDKELKTTADEFLNQKSTSSEARNQSPSERLQIIREESKKLREIAKEAQDKLVNALSMQAISAKENIKLKADHDNFIEEVRSVLEKLLGNEISNDVADIRKNLNLVVNLMEETKLLVQNHKQLTSNLHEKVRNFIIQHSASSQINEELKNLDILIHKAKLLMNEYNKKDLDDNYYTKYTELTTQMQVVLGDIKWKYNEENTAQKQLDSITTQPDFKIKIEEINKFLKNIDQTAKLYSELNVLIELLLQGSTVVNLSALNVLRNIVEKKEPDNILLKNDELQFFPNQTKKKIVLSKKSFENYWKNWKTPSSEDRLLAQNLNQKRARVDSFILNRKD